jgi:tryptophanyl-tRNA synthetase
MTQFKDKSTKRGSDLSSVGLFTYPILQAADILLYDAAIVPVGEDQRQHIELTRDLAGRFNQRFGQTFVEPEVRILDQAAKIFDLQHPTQKMSKSGDSPQGIVWLLDEPAVVAKKIKQAVTDTETEVRFDPVNKPGVSNLLTLFALAGNTTVAEAEKQFSGGGYGPLKAGVIDAVSSLLDPIRQATSELLDDPAELDRLLFAGAKRASEIAEKTLARVYERVGLLAPPNGWGGHP